MPKSHLKPFFDNLVAGDPRTREIQVAFRTLSDLLQMFCPNGPEFQQAMRKLIEARDCAMRSMLDISAAQSHDRIISGQGTAADAQGAVDPITGKLLPVGSPYSQAHQVVRQAPANAAGPNYAEGVRDYDPE